MTAYFLEHVRNQYKLPTGILNEEFITSLKFKSGADETLNYKGTGIIYATGDVLLNTHLIAQDGSGSSSQAFPAQAALAIVTPGDITWNNAGVTQSGLFFAGTSARFLKNVTILGSLVANDVNLSSFVPSIYHVPEVVDYLPSGIIDQTTASGFLIVYWNES